MTAFARDARKLEIPRRSVDVTARAVRRRVRPHQRKPRPIVLRDRVGWVPGIFIVAVTALRTQLSAVHIFMASAAAPVRELLHRSAIIVTQQALRRIVCTLQRDAGLFLVVITEIDF
jgi:hypothetical protein